MEAAQLRQTVRTMARASIASAFHVSSNTAFARLCTAIHPMKVADMAYRLGIESTLTETGSV